MPQAARASSTQEHCRLMPHTPCMAPRAFWPMSLLGWKGIVTVYRLNQVSFSCVLSSPFCLVDAALHCIISLFTLGSYHRPFTERIHTFHNPRQLRARCRAPYYNSVSFLFISDTAFLHYCRCARIRLRSLVSFPPPLLGLHVTNLSRTLNHSPGLVRGGNRPPPALSNSFHLRAFPPDRLTMNRATTPSPALFVSRPLSLQDLSSARYDPFVHPRTLRTATSDLFFFLLMNSHPGRDQAQKQRASDRQR